MEIQQQDRKGQQERRVDGLPHIIGGLGACATREHHEDAVVLSAVVPWTPAEIQREQQW